MKFLSKILQPVLTVPKNAKVKTVDATSKSQRLLVEMGLVRSCAPGTFALLPLAARALRKLEILTESAMEAAGGQRVCLPALTDATLWKRSGRIESMPNELFTLTDRQQRALLLAPTHEETVTELLAGLSPLSHNQLPLTLYQISSKYRDEARARHGLCRAREFLMMDAYSAHVTDGCARATYARVVHALRTLFRALELNVHVVKADSGAMGGSTSHEWHIAAPPGADAVRRCAACRREVLASADSTSSDSSVANSPSSDTSAADSPSSDSKRCDACGGPTELLHTIEVGHTFMLGARYSHALGAQCTSAPGPRAPVLANCYGVGLTRLLGAALDGGSAGLAWPHRIAPFTAVVVPPKSGSREWRGGEGYYDALRVAEIVHDMLRQRTSLLQQDLLVDDRHHLTIGRRLRDHRTMGYPFVIVYGRDAPDVLELHKSLDKSLDRSPDASPELLSPEQLVDRLPDLLPERVDFEAAMMAFDDRVANTVANC